MFSFLFGAGVLHNVAQRLPHAGRAIGRAIVTREHVPEVHTKTGLVACFIQQNARLRRYVFAKKVRYTNDKFLNIKFLE